jgi:hypothetical protein
MALNIQSNGSFSMDDLDLGPSNVEMANIKQKYDPTGGIAGYYKINEASAPPKSQPPVQTSSPTQNLHPKQFGTGKHAGQNRDSGYSAYGKHRQVVIPNAKVGSSAPKVTKQAPVMPGIKGTLPTSNATPNLPTPTIGNASPNTKYSGKHTGLPQASVGKNAPRPAIKTVTQAKVGSSGGIRGSLPSGSHGIPQGTVVSHSASKKPIQLGAPGPSNKLNTKQFHAQLKKIHPSKHEGKNVARLGRLSEFDTRG